MIIPTETRHEHMYNWGETPVLVREAEQVEIWKVGPMYHVIIIGPDKESYCTIVDFEPETDAVWLELVQQLKIDFNNVLKAFKELQGESNS